MSLCRNTLGSLAVSVIGLLVLTCTTSAQQPQRQQQQQQQQPQIQQQNPLAAWPEASQKAAQEMLQKYGRPSGGTPNMLIWEQQDPWAMIIVHRETVDHDFPMPHQDVLAQTVYFNVPADKFDEIAEFDGSVILDRTKGTMTARCDKEPMNFLALNLAHDIATGETSVEEARKAYGAAVKAFMQGDQPPYTQGLQFEPTSAQEAGHPGESIISPGQQPGTAARPADRTQQ